MTPAPLFGLLLSLLGVGGLPEIVKIGERIFDVHAVCWMFSRLTYSQNNQAVFLMSVNKQKAIKKLPFGEFFVERIITLRPAKYHPWRPQIQLFLSTELPSGMRWSESTCRARFSTRHDSRLRLRRFRLKTRSMLRREVLTTS